MNQQALKELMGEVLRDASSGKSACERAFEARLPALLYARDSASGVELAESAVESIVARLTGAVHEPARDNEAMRRILVGLNGRAKKQPLTPRLGWAFAVGAAVALITLGLWLGTLPPVSKVIATPETGTVPPPKSTTPKIPRGPEPESRGQVATTVQEGSGRTTPDKARAEERPLVVGKFGAVGGDAFIHVPGVKEPKPAVEGAVISTGMRIETRDTGRVEILLADGSVLRFGFNTTATIPRSKPGEILLLSARNIELTRGTIYAKVVPTGTGRRFSVTTPVATATVLGTEFLLDVKKVAQSGGYAKPKLQALLQVKSGRVEFANALGREVAASKQETVAVAGSAPTEPKRIRVLKDLVFMPQDGHAHFTLTTSQLDAAGARSRVVYRIGWLGVGTEALSDKGLLVVGVTPNSPAQSGDVRVGDVIVSLNGEPLRDRAVLSREVGRGPGRPIDLRITRDGKSFDIRLITVDRRQDAPVMPMALSRRLQDATWPALFGDVQASLTALQKLASEAPHAAVFNNLGVINEMHDDMAQAIRSYQAAVRLDPDRALYRHNLGFALQIIGNVERSVEELDVAVRLEPAYTDAIRALTLGYTLLNRFADAHAVLDKAIELQPRNVNLWIYRGSAFLDSGRLPEARNAYLEATVLDPTSEIAWHQLGNAYRFERNPVEAEGAFRRVVEINPTAWDSLMPLGSALLAQNRFDEAKAVFESMLDVPGYAAGANDNLAWLYEHLGQDNEAEKRYRRAIELAPDFFGAHNNLGILLGRTGRQKEGVAVLRRAIEIDPAHVSAYRALADIQLDMGDLKNAEKNYRRAIELDSGDASSYGYLGLFLEKSNRLQEALEMFRAAADLERRFAEWHPDLARVLSTLGRFQEALPALREAVRLGPKNAWLHARLGWNLIENHRWEEAVSVLRKGLALGPNEPFALNAMNNLANALIRTGDLDGADKLTEQAFTINPGEAETQATRALLLAHKGTRLDEALELAKASAAQPNPHAWYFEALGFVHFKRGEYDQAIEPLKRAVNDYGKVYLAAGALVTLGQVYEAKKDAPAAIDAYRRALKIEQGNKEAAKAMKRLGG